MFTYFAIVSFLVAALMVGSGRLLQAIVAGLACGVCVALARRDRARPDVMEQWAEMVDRTRPYSAEDFPCPDAHPGRAEVVDTDQVVGFAIVTPKSTATPDDLREMRVRLRDWQRSRPDVTEISGLEALLGGKPPATDSTRFAIPITRLDSTELLALVSLRARDATRERGEELLEVMTGLPCTVVSVEYFEFLCR